MFWGARPVFLPGVWRVFGWGRGARGGRLLALRFIGQAVGVENQVVEYRVIIGDFAGGALCHFISRSNSARISAALRPQPVPFNEKATPMFPGAALTPLFNKLLAHTYRCDLKYFFNTYRIKIMHIRTDIYSPPAKCNRYFLPLFTVMNMAV